MKDSNLSRSSEFGAKSENPGRGNFRDRPVCEAALVGALCLLVGLLPADASGESSQSKWNLRFDVGGAVPESANLTEFGGPVSGESMELTVGFQFDLAAEYQLTPWMGIGPELGFAVNFVDTIAGISPRDTSLWQMLMMVNAVVQYPTEGPVRPFVGAGAGGVASFLTFYDGYYSGSTYYWGSANTGSDFVFGYQAFGGVRFYFNDSWSVGVIYRYLQTDPQRWSTDWGWGQDLTIGVDSIRMHSICLVLSGDF
jgi:opacity protein-like surface antigen